LKKNSSLKEIIIRKIKESGAITFAEFMEMALYYPELGYYTKKRELGILSDYYTSSELHPIFGEIISNQISQMADFINEENFTLIEIGAGKGILANDILNQLNRKNRGLYDRLDFILVEKNGGLLLEISKILIGHKPKVSFVSSIEEVKESQISGCIFSNELIDSFPVHRIIKKDGKLKEIYVSYNGKRFIEEFGAISQSEIEEYINRYGIELVENSMMEVNLGVAGFVKSLSRILKKGFIITIDYGYLADKLYSKSFSEGTLRCYKAHKISTNPYEDIGCQDITAHVNFSDLIYQGHINGFELIDFITQREFLIRGGVLDLISKYSVGKERFTPKLFSELEAIKNLILPDGMGEIFKVLIQQKEISTPKMVLVMK